MHSVHLAGSITKVPFFSEIAIFGHSGSQAEQLVHWELTILKAMMFLLFTKWGRRSPPITLCSDVRALPDLRIPALAMDNGPATDVIEIIPIVGDD